MLHARALRSEAHVLPVLSAALFCCANSIKSGLSTGPPVDTPLRVLTQASFSLLLESVMPLLARSADTAATLDEIARLLGAFVRYVLGVK